MESTTFVPNSVGTYFVNKIQYDSIHFGPLKGSKRYISYQGASGLNIHTPKMRIPFELQDKTTRENIVFMKKAVFSTECKPSKTLLLSEEEIKHNNKHIKKFVAFLDKIDQMVEAEYPGYTLYRSLYNPPDAKYSPTFTCNIKLYQDNLDLQCFDKDEQSVDVNGLTFKNRVAQGVVQLESIWVSQYSKKVGINWMLKQIKFV
jgi:hypothetical protein